MNEQDYNFKRILLGQTNWVYREACKFVNFMNPKAEIPVRGRDHINHIVKMHYFLQNLFVYSWA